MTELTSSHLPQAIFLMGPTASGKTELAIALCNFLPVEIISVDSALIYRGMDIGTAKPSNKQLSLAPHRLINIRDPAKSYSVAEFRRDALQEMQNITKIGRIPLLVGGTMLYFKVLLEGLSPLPPADPEVRVRMKRNAKILGCQALHKQLHQIDPNIANPIHPNDLQRVLRALEVFFISGETVTELIKTPGEALAYRTYQFAIAPLERPLLHQRITQRFHKMLATGFEREVSILFKRGDLHRDLPSIRCVGYRQMWEYLSGESDYDTMVFRGVCATRQLAKRQITWLRRWQNVYWLDSNEPTAALKKVLKVVNV